MRLDGDARAHELHRRQPLIAYVVRVTFAERDVVDRYLPWLRAHVRQVCDAGASDGQIVVVDGEPSVEARYTFASRDVLARYEREDAPRLRQQGMDELARLGVKATFARFTGEIVPTAS